MIQHNKSYNCPVEYAVSVLNGKWKTVILAWLKESPLRYNQLKRKIPNISDKVLTQRLKDLEELGFITKRKQEDGDYNFEYCLTDKGNSLRPVLDALYNWGKSNYARL